MMTAEISAIYTYSVKSGRATARSESAVDLRGLIDDRKYMLVDESGRFLSARRDPKLLGLSIQRFGQQLKIELASALANTVQCTEISELIEVQVWNRLIKAPAPSKEADRLLSDWIGKPVRLVENQAGTELLSEAQSWGAIFNDGYPILVTAEESLAAVNQACMADFEMLRFRPNLVIRGVPAWQEHKLRYLQIGTLVLKAEKPCERCILVTRDPITGDQDQGREPLKTLAQLNRRGGAVCFGENLSVVTPGSVRVGDSVEFVDGL